MQPLTILAVLSASLLWADTQHCLDSLVSETALVVHSTASAFIAEHQAALAGACLATLAEASTGTRMHSKNPPEHSIVEHMAVDNFLRYGLFGGNYSIPNPSKMNGMAAGYSENVHSDQTYSSAGTTNECSD